MVAVGVLVALAAAAAPPPAGWKQIFSATDPRASLSAMVVEDEGTWIVGGGNLIVRGGKGAAEAHSEPDAFIVGMVGGGSDPVLAVGADDLILRWDGHAWIRDSFAAEAPKLGRSRRRRLLLQGGFHPDGQPLTVYGPWRVLTRQADGTWKAPAEAERYRLMILAQMGPKASHPKGCDPLQWRWLTKGDGWLGCRDGRSFLVKADGATTERGRLPKSCIDALGTLVRQGEAIFAACDKGTLWRSEGARWESMQAPKLDAIAANAQCLYGVVGGAVWQNCSP